MNVFDYVTADALKESMNEVMCVEVTEKPGRNFKGEDIVFKNITKCYGEAEEIRDEKPEVVKMTGKQVGMGDMGIKASDYVNPCTTMYTSYAKDIFCAMVNEPELKGTPAEDTMKLSIELVKQAREAFE